MSIEKIKLMRIALNNVLIHLDSLEVDHKKRNASLRALEIELRKARTSYFPTGYFSDAAWDILLDLDNSEFSGFECAVTDVGVAANIPLATTLRYLAKFENDGFVKRTPDSNDHRRSIVSLTDTARNALDQTFNHVANELQESEPSPPFLLSSVGSREKSVYTCF
jgi:DNA-binding MarR family transcriptional regulator